MGKKFNLTGQEFGRLTVNGDSGKRDYDGAIIWDCTCQCGVKVEIRTQALRNGNTKSCGCLYRDTRKKIGLKHGLEGTRLYRIWSGVIQRCTNPNYTYYKNYGGRGITVCEEWKEFVNFKNWAFQNGYEDTLTIDRINVNAGYSSSNCRWATKAEQAQNTTLTKMITIGSDTKCLMEWVRDFDLKYSTVHNRIRRGDPECLWFLTKEDYLVKRRK
jgi:hypothetical protein